MTQTIHIDFETYSEAPILKTGAWAYAAHHSTEVLCMAYWVPETMDSPELLTNVCDITDVLRDHLQAGSNLHAWNSFFEMSVAYHVLGLDEALDPTRWTDTAAAAAALALPRSLGDCGAALGLSQDQQKDKRGRYLIQRLCKPYRGKRVYDDTLLEELYDYCKQDVIAEHTISRRLRPLSEPEKRVWECDQTINIRGLGIDTDAVSHGIELAAQAVDALNKEVTALTDGELTNTSQRNKVLGYLETIGCPMASFDKTAVTKQLEDPNTPAKAKRILGIRQQTSKTSVAKYAALQQVTTDDNRAHGLLMYHGASTGRWTGRHFQPQNLPRPSFDDTDSCVDSFATRDHELIDMLWGDTMEALSSCVRSMIVPSAGKRLYVADYSAIEARVLAWLASQHDVIAVFEGHGKLYEHTASQIYNTPVEQVSKNQRQIGKVATLALGYQGSVGAFQSMAVNYGVVVEDDFAASVVADWRAANRETVSFWYELDHAAIQAVQTDEMIRVGRSGVAFKVMGDFLFCRLPSSRLLAYYQPQIQEGRFGNDQVTYMGVNSYSRKWERQHIYGGKWAENITQAVARDLMAGAMLHVEAAGYEVVLTVHDEILAESANGSIEEFCRLLCACPDWAAGLPLAADGFVADRYRKG